MKIKKLVLSIMTVLGVWISWSSCACATTWYVRDGGGTAAQCTGRTNAVYPGSGTSQNCAFNHPRIVLGYSTGNGSVSGVMAGGDTMYIDGDSDTHSGGAQYEMGYDDITAGASTPGCASAQAYSCIPNAPPAGISSTQMTTIIGTGTHQPQLWGNEGMQEILNLTNGNLDFENIEITQHSSCSNVLVTSSVNYGIYPSGCGGTSYGKYPVGPSIAAAGWAKFGIQLQGTNITTKNLWIHNLANSDIYFPGNVTNWNSSNDKIDAAGGTLDDGGSMTFGGNNTMTNDVWAWGGCMEKYPLPDPGNVKDTNNYINCADQNYYYAYGGSNGNNALGGGFMMQNNTSGSCGNWTITSSQFLFNLKTNIDFLHCNGTGTFNLFRSRSEGSSGEALKLNVASANIEESQLIGNAPVWETAPFQALKAPATSGSWDYFVCRGNDVTVFASTNGSVYNYLNSDITGNCTDLIGLSGTSSCSTNPVFNVYNSKLIMGNAYDIGGGFVDAFYNASSCGVTFNENYNSMSNADNSSLVRDPQHCTGSHDLCGTNPKLTVSPLSSYLGPTAYYSGTSLGDELYLTSSSPLIRTGESGLAYANGSSNDYNNAIATNNPPDIGSIQYSSCITANNFCSISGECCNGATCSSGQCGGSGATPGSSAISQPVVVVTSSAGGNLISVGSSVTITATALEANGTITNLAIYNGSGILLGSSSSSTYNIVDTNLLPGAYTFYAMATDANGVSTISSSITVTATSLSAPVVAITSPQNGSTFAVGTTNTSTATASETNGTIAKVSYYSGSYLLGSSSTPPYSCSWTNATAGSFTITAQATDANGVSTTSTPITMTVTASPVTPSLPVVAITSPVNGSTFTVGSSNTVTAAASETNGTIAKVSYYSGSYLLGSSGTPPYSYSWTNSTAGSYIITAQATDANGVSTTSSPITMTVTASPVTPSLPVVAITSPLNGSTFIVGSTNTVTATASEANGTIAKVSYYSGSYLLGSSSTPPYSYSWTNATAGSFTITAQATDANGVSTTSTPITMTVTASPVTPSLPVVAITSPQNASTYSAGSNITITASASETNGTIAGVSFYNGTMMLGASSTSPYSFSWTNVPAGSYTLTAKAADANGVLVTSSPAAVTVTATSSSPVVAIATPANGSTYMAGSSITITATALETNGTISSVYFSNGKTILGSSSTSPYSYKWTNVTAGSYALTATASDSQGVSVTSPPVPVTINPSRRGFRH